MTARTDLTRAQRRALDGLEVSPRLAIDTDGRTRAPYDALVALGLARFKIDNRIGYHWALTEAGRALAR